MLFEIENIVWMNMADSSASKQAQRYNEKLKSLNGLHIFSSLVILATYVRIHCYKLLCSHSVTIFCVCTS